MTITRAESHGLSLGGIELSSLARDPRIGTPTYLYDLDGIARGAEELTASFQGERHLIAYALKANTAGPIVRLLAARGYGADVVSGAEIDVALGAGVPPEKIVFSGVAKTDAEIDRAISLGSAGILSVQVESAEEILRVAARARLARRTARVSLRVNPAIEMETLATHAHIATGHDEAKFGIPLAELPGALAASLAAKELRLVGMACHVGSQFTTTEPYIGAARKLFHAVREMRDSGAGASLEFLDTGGGFGIDYGAGCPASPADFVRETLAEQRAFGLHDLPLHIEPGRCLVAAHGVLLARVVQAKVTRDARWLLLDAGMNDLLRPALYQAHHRIVTIGPVKGKRVPWRVVGPVCESSDDFGVHEFGEEPPEFVAVLDAGAYGFTMASEYNGRPLPAEVFLRGGEVSAVSKRGSVDAWVASRLAIGRNS